MRVKVTLKEEEVREFYIEANTLMEAMDKVDKIYERRRGDIRKLQVSFSQATAFVSNGVDTKHHSLKPKRK